MIMGVNSLLSIFFALWPSYGSINTGTKLLTLKVTLAIATLQKFIITGICQIVPLNQVGPFSDSRVYGNNIFLLEALMVAAEYMLIVVFLLPRAFTTDDYEHVVVWDDDKEEPLIDGDKERDLEDPDELLSPRTRAMKKIRLEKASVKVRRDSVDEAAVLGVDEDGCLSPRSRDRKNQNKK